jgi:CheY-like chemotaxis protein
MRMVRTDSDRPIPPGAGGAVGLPAARLNLLLSLGGWQEDPWTARLPRLLEPMGVRAVEARSASQATRVIRTTSVHIAVVDLGLPFEDGGPEEPEAGPGLLELLRRLECPPPTVVVKRGRTARDDRREIAAALRAGAFAVLDRPRDTTDLEAMLTVLQRVLARHYAGRWPAAGGDRM